MIHYLYTLGALMGEDGPTRVILNLFPAPNSIVALAYLGCSSTLKSKSVFLRSNDTCVGHGGPGLRGSTRAGTHLAGHSELLVERGVSALPAWSLMQQRA